MTPRTLLAAIGSTAIAFAIAIGVAAGSAADQASPAITAHAASKLSTVSAQHEVAQFTLQTNQDCPYDV